MTAPGYFVTGTDTGVGKTAVAAALMRALQRRGLSVAGMKPIAAGCSPTPQGLRNDDALRLQAQDSVELPYDTVNPYAFEPPIAPHVAAAEAGVEIRAARILEAFGSLQAQVECVVVEGIGGWQVPINGRQTTADLARELGLPVVLVVGLRLGCLNHALLTRDAIRSAGVGCAGWVATQIEPGMSRADDILHALQERLGAPLLGAVPYLDPWDPGAFDAYIEAPGRRPGPA
ncbi:MAG: dethiobiotin synthase [Gammaproteobacteria bacterium]|nr:dethiobiotin synthase [Gammaproteobacteria bacterium]